MKGLKQCPFCGLNGEIHFTPGRNGVATCHICGTEHTLVIWQSRPIEDALQARINELEHKNEVLMDSYLESETINDKGELVGSLEYFKKRIADLEAENEALRLIAGSHSMSELRRNRIMAGWRRGDTLKNEVKHE